MSQSENGGGSERGQDVSNERGARFFLHLDPELVRQARLEEDITQARAAIGCGIDLKTYKRAEAGLSIDVETARSVGQFYGRDYTEFQRKSEQTGHRPAVDDGRPNSQALGTNEASIEEEQHSSRRNTLNVPPTTQVVEPMDFDEQRDFSLLGVGGLDAIVEFAYDKGFVLFSEQDVKQFFLRLADAISEDDEKSRYIHTIVGQYSTATDGPAGLYVTVNNGAALKSWVEKQFGRICQRMEKSDQDLLRESTQEAKAELLAHVSPGSVIVSLDAWHILENLIVRKTKGKGPWWQELDLLVRKGDLSFRTAESIKMFNIVLRTVLANGEYANALDADLLVILVGLCFVLSTKLTGA
jgi:hypothetical protein